MKSISLGLFVSLLVVSTSTAHTHHHDSIAASEPASNSIFNSTSKWRTSDGRDFTLTQLSGKPSLVGMVYTSCATACPMTIEELKTIAKSAPPELRDRLQFVVLSFDETNDTPEHLKAFAKKRNLDDRWILLSPRMKEDSTEIAALLGIRFKKLPDGNYIHSNVHTLVNEKGEIVARKEGFGSDRFDVAKALGK